MSNGWTIDDNAKLPSLAIHVAKLHAELGEVDREYAAVYERQHRLEQRIEEAQRQIAELGEKAAAPVEIRDGLERET